MRKKLRVGELNALLDRRDGFFGLDTLGPNMGGSAMHSKLLKAHDKLAAESANL